MKNSDDVERARIEAAESRQELDEAFRRFEALIDTVREPGRLLRERPFETAILIGAFGFLLGNRVGEALGQRPRRPAPLKAAGT